MQDSKAGESAAGQPLTPSLGTVLPVPEEWTEGGKYIVIGKYIIIDLSPPQTEPSVSLVSTQPSETSEKLAPCQC